MYRTLLFLAFIAPLAAQGEKEWRLSPEEVAPQQHRRQPQRPQFHYSPLQGFIGDSTGMVFARGKYHLFYMSDRWHHERRDHKKWGYATSTDMLHWQEMPSVLDTKIDNKPGSGCGLIDPENTSGLTKKGQAPPLLIFYTHYGKGTSIAYSHDDGASWTRYEKNPVLPGRSHRDPLIFWYPPKQAWQMLRYEDQEPEVKRFSFYQSKNLLEWEKLSDFEGVYECPDFMELPVENSPGEKRWVLIDGNGSYFIGSYDGVKFSPEPGTKRQRVEHGDLYATQSWKQTANGNTPVQMAWLRYPGEFQATKDPKRRLTWWGQQSFPCELRLRKFPDGIKLCRAPIPALKELYATQSARHDFILKPGENALKDHALTTCELRLDAEVHPDSQLKIHLGQAIITYANGTLTCDDKSVPYAPTNSTLRLQILFDRSSIEVFAGDGELSISKASFDWDSTGKISLTAADHEIKVHHLHLNHLRSIWETDKTKSE